MRFAAIVIAILLSTSLTGCDSEDCWLCWGQPNQGRLTLGVTALPTEQATDVVLTVSRVSFLNEASEWKQIDLEPPRQLDLLTDTGEQTLLLDGVLLESGSYRTIQLTVDAYPDSANSYVNLGDFSSTYPLELTSTPSLNSTFEMPRQGPLERTIAFDLHRGLRGPVTHRDGTEIFRLTPYVRLIETGKSGGISGSIAASQMQHPNCTRSSGSYLGFVYVFTGRNVSPLDTLNRGDPPIASIPAAAPIGADSFYRANYLPEGDYTLALVCEGDTYQPYAATNIEIRRVISASVAAGRITESANFQ